MSSARLGWRIPTTGDPRLLKLSLAQVGLATIVAAGLLVVAVPRQWLGPALAGLVPLAVLVAYWRWQQFQRSLVGPENVWIDEAGLHWFDGTETERLFSRADVVGFRIAHEADTLRAIPALTLHLANGFESQPIELYPPATPTAVREMLTGDWELHEQTVDASRGETAYDYAVSVYSECHDDTHEWHWEGSREALADFFALFQRAAEALPLPPPGAKPKALVVLLQRRLTARLRLAHSLATHFEHDAIAAPAGVLRNIANQAAQMLTDVPGEVDRKFDVQLGPSDTWTFHLHVHDR